MNRHVSTIGARLSLRPPQRESLEILQRVTELIPLAKAADQSASLKAVYKEFPTVESFGREFPSLCFALATGVGKTRLMGAFITYLHLAHRINNFFVLAPNLTVYDKLLRDFTIGTPKYVFKGIAEFVTAEPIIIDSENYVTHGISRNLLSEIRINIFNISKLNVETRGGRPLKIHGFRETLGENYFEYLSNLDDLVLIMDESHRYHGTAGWRALNELKPVLGLELTATPFVETPRGPQAFKNIIFDYPLGRAMADGYVKEPAVVTRQDFNPAGMSARAIQTLKLEDGIRLHERVKIELKKYSAEHDRLYVKPFALVIARDTAHAAELKTEIESPSFLSGRYFGRVIQVDSSSKEEETVQRLLNVELAEEPTEIVIHVNMLKEGWDVTNLYTIIPLRAANARTLIEQSIGRGLRLPYGARTGNSSVDRLNIVAHDRFQEIVDAANQPDSPIRLTSIVLTDQDLRDGLELRRSLPRVEAAFVEYQDDPPPVSSNAGDRFRFIGPERGVARLALEAFRRYEREPTQVPTSSDLLRADIQSVVVSEVERRWGQDQHQFSGIGETPNVADVVSRAAEFLIQNTIDIPRILVTPIGEVQTGFRPFTLDLASVRPRPDGSRLWLQELRTGLSEAVPLGLARTVANERRLEDYIVRCLMDFPDVDYGRHSDLLYDLANQLVRHLSTYLSAEESASVLRAQDESLARLIHSQMQLHYHESASHSYDVAVKRGWTTLRESIFTVPAGQVPLDFRIAPRDKLNINRYVFGGFKRCLYECLKFDSDAERRLAIILDRETHKWFKPARGQFQIQYHDGHEQSEYVPDFVAESDNDIFMMEPKSRDQLGESVVRAKADAAREWCTHASAHSIKHGGKPWSYILLPHDVISENMSLLGLVSLGKS